MTANQIAMILTLACVLGGMGLFGWLVTGAIRSGIFPSRHEHINRDKQPGRFWGAVTFHLLAIAALAAIGGYALWRLATGA